MNDKYLHSIPQDFGTFSEILLDSSKSERYTLICKIKYQSAMFCNILWGSSHEHCDLQKKRILRKGDSWPDV